MDTIKSNKSTVFARIKNALSLSREPVVVARRTSGPQPSHCAEEVWLGVYACVADSAQGMRSLLVHLLNASPSERARTIASERLAPSDGDDQTCIRAKVLYKFLEQNAESLLPQVSAQVTSCMSYTDRTPRVSNR